VGGDDIQAFVDEEIFLASSARNRWHAEYLGCAYRAAVELATAQVDRNPLIVLKADLWNECLGGTRDIVGHFQEKGTFRFFGLDLLYLVCVQGSSRVPTMPVVQADIRALPFRTGSFDAVLDLSTLDHLPEVGVAQAIGEYRRVLRDSGALLLIFWQRNFVIRQRLFLKELFGRREKLGQHYLARTYVKAKLGRGLVVVREFAAGSLLIPPQRLTSLLLGRLPAGALMRLLAWLVPIERSSVARPLLKHIAGLYGIVALRRRNRDGSLEGGKALDKPADTGWALGTSLERP
jgi:SAM-dependent methyltransferase